MLTSALTFLGGSAFRMLWGEISAIWTKHQDHKHELERMRFEAEQAEKAHFRNKELIELQHANGLQIVQVQGEIDLNKLDAATFGKSVETTAQSTGIKWVDGWNAAIRAALATECMVLISLHYHAMDWKLDDRGWELAGAVLGVFVADRLLFRRGK